MKDDGDLDVERQKLFAMVWERPAEEVAKELGVSGVALGKLCRRLQVPKPPRGYWARVASGQTPRRPPLPAYRAEIAERLRKQARSTTPIRLSKLQLEFLGYAMDELKAAGVDADACVLAYDGIRAIPPELAAQVLLVLQSRYEEWLDDRPTAGSVNGTLSSLRSLVEKLQPHAKEQLLVFHRKPDDGFSQSNSPTISLHATYDLLTRFAHLSRVARDNGLAYVAADMSSLNHAWSVNQIFSPGARCRADTQLCVSPHEVWVRADVKTPWSRDRFETIRMPLRKIFPIDLMPPNECRLPSRIRRFGVKPYAGRLQALQEGQAIYEALVNATYDMDRALPDERLALFDRLLFSKGETGPFIGARHAWRQMEADLVHPVMQTVTY